MITPCRLIYPYYEAPEMLARQIENWDRYAGELRKNIKIIVVDDGSTKDPAVRLMEHCKAPRTVYRIKEHIPWGQHGARNIGAKEAWKDDGWMFMSDLDVLLTAEMAYALLSRQLNGGCHYTFERVFAPDFKERKVHCNTFLVKKRMFWRAGGYDEDYCGTYGGDGPFLRQLKVICPNEHLEDIELIGYGRRQRDADPVFKGADTSIHDREKYAKKYRELFERKRESGDERAKNPFRRPWERQL